MTDRPAATTVTMLCVACAILLVSPGAAAQQVEFGLSPAFVPSRPLGNLAWGVAIEEIPGLSAVIDAPMALGGAMALAPTITVHGPHRLSHEILYTYATAPLVIFGSLAQVILLGPDGSVIDQSPSTDLTRYTETLTVRQAGYNLLVHVLPSSRRVSPYVVVGSAVTSFQFRDVPRPPAGVFRVALRDVGGVLVAIGLGRTSPLEGGTVFRLGLSYGAGVRVRIRGLLNLRIDLRETVMRDPDFFNRQSATLNAGGIFTGQEIGTHRRTVLAAGLSVGF